MFPTPDFPPEAIFSAKQHALRVFPQESCGLIVDGAYVACENTAADPENDFRIDPEEIIAGGGKLQAVLHSHPNAVREPSAADMQGQIDTNVIWGIIPCNHNEAFDPVFWGDFLLERPLIGREFLHGVNDCGSLIRAYFWQIKGIRLPDFSREDDWWKKGDDIYRINFAAAGFRRIDDIKNTLPGDVFLGQVRSTVPNHGGILLENGLALHHLAGKLSRREPLGPWQKHVTHWLRHDGQAQG